MANERVWPMWNPPHLGEFICQSKDHWDWNVTETAKCLRCGRARFSRLLNSKAGLSAKLALALQHIGWDIAGHWARMQASYELRRRVEVELPPNEALKKFYKELERKIWLFQRGLTKILVEVDGMYREFFDLDRMREKLDPIRRKETDPVRHWGRSELK